MRFVLQTAVFVGVFYFALPAGFIVLNAHAGWPRWQSDASELAGWSLVALGSGVFLYCAGLFRRLGRGTPAPNMPPTRMVVSGPYLWSRNPMYVGYLAIAVGIFLVEGHAALLLYVAVYFLIGDVYLRRWEEPALRERFGSDYEAYESRVRRWLGRRPAGLQARPGASGGREHGR